MRLLKVDTALLSPGLIDVTHIVLRQDAEFFGPLLQVIRACYATLQFVQSDQVIISEDVAKALNVQRGDTIRYIKAK
jgi:hypothetical protein